jgi:hypothetical protein
MPHEGGCNVRKGSDFLTPHFLTGDTRPSAAGPIVFAEQLEALARERREAAQQQQSRLAAVQFRQPAVENSRRRCPSCHSLDLATERTQLMRKSCSRPPARYGGRRVNWSFSSDEQQPSSIARASRSSPLRLRQRTGGVSSTPTQGTGLARPCLCAPVERSNAQPPASAAPPLRV